VARSTTLIIVVGTTLIFGTFMKQTQYFLLGKPKQEHTPKDEFDRRMTHYEEIAHPNLD